MDPLGGATSPSITKLFRTACTFERVLRNPRHFCLDRQLMRVLENIRRDQNNSLSPGDFSIVVEVSIHNFQQLSPFATQHAVGITLRGEGQAPYSVEPSCTATVRLTRYRGVDEGRRMRTLVSVIAAALLSNVCLAQVGTTVKEGAKATGEKTQEIGDQAKAAVSSQPTKATSKAKAQSHKVKAHEHAHASKEAAKEIPK